MIIVSVAVKPKGSPLMLIGLLGIEGLNYWPMPRGWLRPPPSKGQVSCFLKAKTVGISPSTPTNTTVRDGINSS